MLRKTARVIAGSSKDVVCTCSAFSFATTSATTFLGRRSLQTAPNSSSTSATQTATPLARFPKATKSLSLTLKEDLPAVLQRKILLASPSDAYRLAAQLEELCEANRLPEALNLLRYGRREARTSAVYSVVIRELLKRKENKLAWTMWMEMKRAGITPSARSYSTFFSSIVPSSVSRTVLANIHALHEQWQKQCAKLEDDPKGKCKGRPDSDAVTVIPTNAYLTLVSRLSGTSYSDVLDSIDTLPKTGAVTADRQTYTLAIRSMLQTARKDSTTSQELKEVAQRFEELWKHVKSQVLAGKLEIDARSLSSVMQMWRVLDQRDRTLVDRAAVLRDIEGITGLTSSTRDSEQSQSPAVKLDDISFFDALVLANLFSNKNSRLAKKWFDQVRQKQSRNDNATLNARHCILAMRSDPSSAEDILVWQIRHGTDACRPDEYTYESAMQCSNFPAALRILARCTGKNDILLLPSEKRLLSLPEGEDPTKFSQRFIKGRHTKVFQPTVKMMNALMQSALETHDWRRLHRAMTVLRKLDFTWKAKHLQDTPAHVEYKRLLRLITRKLKDHPSVDAPSRQLYGEIFNDVKLAGRD